MITRPLPPAEMFEAGGPDFLPAPELESWAREVFIEEGGALENEEHQHLRLATLGFVWTTVANTRAGHRIVGQCEKMPPMAMGKWARARMIHLIESWFGDLPDFVITIDAMYAAQADDLEFCATVDHELLHAGQEMGPFGPKFTKGGRPKFDIRGHDVEEFVSIVRRYGVQGGAGATRALVEAAQERPLIGSANISQACGTCALLRAA